MRPFRDISIFPSYYDRAAVVAWKVDPMLDDAEFYIYKKNDGGAEWELLSTTPTFGTWYEDTDFYITDKLQTPCYRVLAILNGKEYDSPEVALYDNVDRQAYGAAEFIIKNKFLQAQMDGIPVLYYPVRRSGDLTSTLDSETGQRMSATCSDDDEDYGTYYSGGYYRPFITYVRFLDTKPTKVNILDTGVFDASVQKVEFLAYPPVRTNDLVVDVSTDRRWLVGNSIETHLVKSVIPVSYTGTLSLQDRNNTCYKVSIPDNYRDLVRKLTYPVIKK